MFDSWPKKAFPEFPLSSSDGSYYNLHVMALTARSLRPSLSRPVVSCRPRASFCRASSSPSSSSSSSVPAASSVQHKAGVALTSFAAPLVLAANDAAYAVGGEHGILEGRTFALLHPAVEFFLLGTTTYAGYLGFQWRRARKDIPEEIEALKALVPAPQVAVGANGDEEKAPEVPENPKIAELQAERKEILAAGVRDKHTVWGNLLLGTGVVLTFEGCFNTFLRTGKLFPGPHLYAGATITCLWAIAAAMTPAMQKGNETARSIHIALNAVNFGLFLWQVPTGLEIVGKVFQFTSWP